MLLLNKNVWNGLSDQEKAWVDEASGKWLSMQGAEVYLEQGKKGLAVAREKGLEIIELSADERARWDATIKPVLDDWKAREIGQGLTGQQIYDLFQGK